MAVRAPTLHLFARLIAINSRPPHVPRGTNYHYHSHLLSMTKIENNLFGLFPLDMSKKEKSLNMFGLICLRRTQPVAKGVPHL